MAKVNKDKLERTREAFLKIRQIERDLERGNFTDIDFFIQYSGKTALNYALEWAAFHGNCGIIEKILETEADIHANNDVALQMACENGHLSAVILLLSRGANINANNGEPLSRAVSNNHMDIVKHLLNYDPTAVLKNIMDSINAAQFIIRVEPHEIDIGRGMVWLPEKCNININNDIALRTAVEKGLYEMTKLLIDNGADKYIFDNYLFTLAKNKGYSNILELLKDN